MVKSLVGWKPLDVFRQRLYQVTVSYPPTDDCHGVYTETRLMFGNSPTHAAERVAAGYAEIPTAKRPSCKGTAIAVGQPSEWFEDNKTVPPCAEADHENTHIEGLNGNCTNNYNIFICKKCGSISLVVRPKEGERFVIRFGINCDDHLRYAAKYLRSEAETEEALRRAKKLDTPE